MNKEQRRMHQGINRRLRRTWKTLRGKWKSRIKRLMAQQEESA